MEGIGGKVKGKGWEMKEKKKIIRKVIRYRELGKNLQTFGKDFKRKNEKERREDKYMKILVHVIWKAFKIIRMKREGKVYERREKVILQLLIT